MTSASRSRSCSRWVQRRESRAVETMNAELVQIRVADADEVLRGAVDAVLGAESAASVTPRAEETDPRGGSRVDRRGVADEADATAEPRSRSRGASSPVRTGRSCGQFPASRPGNSSSLVASQSAATGTPLSVRGIGRLRSGALLPVDAERRVPSRAGCRPSTGVWACCRHRDRFRRRQPRRECRCPRAAVKLCGQWSRPPAGSSSGAAELAHAQDDGVLSASRWRRSRRSGERRVERARELRREFVVLRVSVHPSSVTSTQRTPTSMSRRAARHPRPNGCRRTPSAAAARATRRTP